MSAIRPARPSANGHTTTPMRRPAVLADADRWQLMRHLAWCDAARPSPYLGHVLRHRLAASRPCGAEPPADAVTGGCQVTYAIGGGPARSGLVTHGAGGTAAESGVIPVLSLLGATLIGLRVGQSAPVLHEDGTIARLTVLRVTRPPEPDGECLPPHRCRKETRRC